MTHYIPYLYNELKRFFSAGNLAILTVVLVLAAYTVHQSIGDYKHVLRDQEHFKQTEGAIFKHTLNYTEYSYKGVGSVVRPSPNSILFDGADILSDLSGRVDSIARLDIFNNRKGTTIIRNNASYRFKFSDIILYIGSFLALLYGANAARDKEYLKVLVSIRGNSRLGIYTTQLTARILVAAVSFIILLGLMIGLMGLEGIRIPPPDQGGLLGYAAGTLLIIMQFMVLGNLLGYVRVKGYRQTLIFSVWFMLVFVIPSVTNTIQVDDEAGIPSHYHLFRNKIERVDEWEKKTQEKYGKFNPKNIEIIRKFMKDYLRTDYLEVENMDKAYRQKLFLEIERIRNRSIYSPVSFYNLTCGEVSSRGYGNYFAYYDYLIGYRRGFVRFWIDRVFNKESKEMANYVKGDENIYKAQSELPANFVLGMAVNGIYFLLLWVISFMQYRRSHIRLDAEELAGLGSVEQDLTGLYDGMFIVGTSRIYGKLLYNLLSGDSGYAVRKGFRGKISIRGEEISTGGRRYDFVYMCKPGELPGDIKPGNVFRLFTSFYRLSRERRQELQSKYPELDGKMNLSLKRLTRSEIVMFQLMLLRTAEAAVYQVSDLGEGVTARTGAALKKHLQLFEAAGRQVIYLTGSGIFRPVRDENEPESHKISDGAGLINSLAHAEAMMSYEGELKTGTPLNRVKKT